MKKAFYILTILILILIPLVPVSGRGGDQDGLSPRDIIYADPVGEQPGEPAGEPTQPPAPIITPTPTPNPYPAPGDPYPAPEADDPPFWVGWGLFAR